MQKQAALGTAGRQWLKTVHLALGAVWLGAGISMLVLRLTWTPSGQSDLYAVNQAVGLINDWIIIPTAVGSLLTGLLESWLTPWGFFRHRWVTVKWILTVGIIVGSAVITAPWDRGMEAISRDEGLMALQNPVYLRYQSLVILTGAGKVAALLTLIAISVLKPWRRRGTPSLASEPLAPGAASDPTRAFSPSVAWRKPARQGRSS